MKFARWTFTAAGVWGLLVLTPMLFLEAHVSAAYPPAITHPEHYYGFVGVALAWQVAFLILARDPARYRPLMIPAVLEKLAYALCTIALFAVGRTSGAVLATGLLDLVLAALFVVAFLRTRPAAP